MIADIIEEVYLALVQHQRCGNRVYARIAPALVEKATGLVEIREEVVVCVASIPL